MAVTRPASTGGIQDHTNDECTRVDLQRRQDDQDQAGKREGFAQDGERPLPDIPPGAVKQPPDHRFWEDQQQGTLDQELKAEQNPTIQPSNIESRKQFHITLPFRAFSAWLSVLSWTLRAWCRLASQRCTSGVSKPLFQSLRSAVGNLYINLCVLRGLCGGYVFLCALRVLCGAPGYYRSPHTISVQCTGWSVADFGGRT